MVKFRIKYYDAYYVYMGHCPSVKNPCCPVVTDKKDDSTLFTKGQVKEKINELIEFISNEHNAISFEVIPVEVE